MVFGVKANGWAKPLNVGQEVSQGVVPSALLVAKRRIVIFRRNLATSIDPFLSVKTKPQILWIELQRVSPRGGEVL